MLYAFRQAPETGIEDIRPRPLRSQEGCCRLQGKSLLQYSGKNLKGALYLHWGNRSEIHSF